MRYYVKYDETGKVTRFQEYPYENQTMTEVSKAEYFRLRYEAGDSSILLVIKSESSASIKSACADAIIGGFDADVLGRGSLHYTLTEIQQRDLQSQYAAVRAGATGVFWHDTSRVTHETYTAAQFTSLFNTGYAYMISCKIRSDWLEQLAHDLADAGKLTEAAAVDWATVLPESYQTQCDAQIAAMLEAQNA